MKSVTQKVLLECIATRQEWVKSNLETIVNMKTKIKDMEQINREHNAAIREMRGDLEALGL